MTRNGPPEREEPGPHPGTGSNHKALADTTTNTGNGTAMLRHCVARRSASRRLPGGDPWRYDPPTRGYEEAAAHLLGHGLTPAPDRVGLHRMWKCGGHQRIDAETIAERWDLAS